jgi:prepilin-type N-terminal cleavage/methylation domain-containing protein
MPQPNNDHSPCHRPPRRSAPPRFWTAHLRAEGAPLRRGGPGRRRPAFTMIELMVVIGIIAILIALLVIVGGRVAGTGKQSATLSTIKALDATMGAVLQERGRLPRAVVRDPRSDAANEGYWPIADGSWEVGGESINSAGWFLQLASEIPGASDLTGLDPELLRLYSPTAASSISTTPADNHPLLTTPMDGWGNPIRFVHPDFDGNRLPADPWTLGTDYAYVVDEVIRIGAVNSAAELDDLNADGGFAPGNQPYFYSAGPDGKVGVQVNTAGDIVEDFNEDNVYSVKPEFDLEAL